MVSIETGRNAFLTSADKELIKDFLKPDPFNKSTAEFREFVQSLVDERLNSSGISSSEVSDRFLSKLDEELGIHTGDAEETTDARAAAVADQRNSFTFAALNTAISKIVKKQFILNADATQFTVGHDMKKKVQVKYLEKLNGRPLKVLPVKDSEGHGLFTIKYYLLITAGGDQADPIYIIADDKMGENDIDIHEIKQLSVNSGIDSTAWVVFCKSRACNAAFYKWFNESILLPFIQALRKKYTPNDLSSPACFQLDGESTQIDIYKDPKVISKILSSNVIVAKPPASTTAVTQPCDRGNVFRGSKATLKAINDKSIEWDPDTVDTIRDIFTSHRAKYFKEVPVKKKKSAAEVSSDVVDDDGDKSTSSKKQPMTAAHVTLGVFGLLRVHHAISSAIRRATIVESFQLCGVYPLNVNRILDDCTTPITPDERLFFASKLPMLVSLLEKHGEITDADFDKLNFPASKVSSKDNLVLNRRRCIVLTNLSLISKELVKLEQKEAAEKAKLANGGKRGRKRKNTSDATPIQKKPAKAAKKTK